MPGMFLTMRLATGKHQAQGHGRPPQPGEHLLHERQRAVLGTHGSPYAGTHASPARPGPELASPALWLGQSAALQLQRAWLDPAVHMWSQLLTPVGVTRQAAADPRRRVQAFLSGAFKKDLNRDNPLGMHGELAEAFGSLMHLLWRVGAQRGLLHMRVPVPRVTAGWHLRCGMRQPCPAREVHRSSTGAAGQLHVPVSGPHQSVHQHGQVLCLGSAQHNQPTWLSQPSPLASPDTGARHRGAWPA